MSPAQLHILQHSLGVDEHGRGPQYRNRFVTDPDCSDGKVCAELVALGLMRDLGAMSLAGGMHCYHVTAEGKVAMWENSPKPPKLTRSQVRYREWLRGADALGGMKFGQWLRRGRATV